MATSTTPRLALGQLALAVGLLGAFAFVSALAVDWWVFTRPREYVVYVAASSFDGFGAVQTIGSPLLLVAFLSTAFAVVRLLTMLAHRLVAARPADDGRAS
jgi:hypothetical protein